MQVENEPTPDLHSFGVGRFHRSMGPAVGLAAGSAAGRERRRRTPLVQRDEAFPDRTASSTGDLRAFLLRKGEIEDEDLADAAFRAGFTRPRRFGNSSNTQAPVAPGNSCSFKMHAEFTRSPRDRLNSPDMSREGSRVLSACPDEGSPRSKWSPRDSPKVNSPFKVQPMPEDTLLHPQEQMLLQTQTGPLFGKGAATKVKGNFPGWTAGASPESWRRAQKRSVKVGSSYSSRMRAILVM